MSKGNVGFIGLGLMGSAFTERLVGLGYTVTVHDLDTDKVADAVKRGCVAADNAAAVTSASDIVMVCVISTAAVRDVVLGSGGVVEAGSNDKVLVDFSTTLVEDTRELAGKLAERCGMGFVDAPVSGGPPAAGDGTLAIMTGGSEADMARVESVLADLSSSCTHMGAVGAGQVTKMVNQVVVLNNFVVLAEACALAEANGIDAARVPDALRSGYAGSRFMDVMFPRLVARDFEPAGYARQVLKDLDTVTDLARSVKVPVPMSSQAASLFRILVAKGHAERDALAVLKLFDADETL